MKDYLILFVFMLISNFSIAQHRNFNDSNPPNVTEVSFEKDNIILNGKIAYKYERNENTFVIKNIEDEKLIEGNIENIGYKKFKTIINFLAQNIEFTNPQIVGRNDLIFAFVNFNVFEKDGSINEKRLKLFFKKFNTL
ncbi:MAG TPA: hypothetical protein VKY44_10450 [Flavobacterium sp.]|nr:hypothetical protein [Flavobacterium sp.]